MKTKSKTLKILSLFTLAVLIFTTVLPTVFAESAINVTVGIYDYTAVTALNEKASNSGVIMENYTVSIESTALAIDAFKKACEDNEITYTAAQSQFGEYISEINGLSGGDCGDFSGWMFSLNDNFGNSGASATSLSDGDVLKFHYSVTGGPDVGSYWAGGPEVTKISFQDTEIEVSNEAVESGTGTEAEPYVVNFESEEDLTSVNITLTATLNPEYLEYVSGDGLADLEGAVDLTENIVFGIQTVGGFYKTYYKLVNAKTEGTSDNYEANTDPLPEYTGDWTSFTGSENNMVISEALTPRTADGVNVKWTAKFSNDWSENFTQPIIADNYLYIIKVNKILKIDPTDGSVVMESDELEGEIGYGLSSLTYGGGMLFAPIGSGRIQALRADTLESLWVSEAVGGQTITPITYKDGYIYTGTWSDETADGTYFCIDITDEDVNSGAEEKTCAWKLVHNGGFYWAGAYYGGDYLVFGSDNGTEDAESASLLYSVNPANGEVIDTMEAKGDIRSSVSYDGNTDRIYFTTKSGYLYGLRVNADGTFSDDVLSLYLEGMSTSTPVIYEGLAFVGVCGENAFAEDGHTIKIIEISNDKLDVVSETETPGYVQTTPFISNAYEKDFGKFYVYATYNYSPGGIFVIEVSKNEDEFSADGYDLYVPDGNLANYCICNPIADASGNIYYKNDSGYLIALERVPLTGKSILSFKIDDSEGEISEEEGTIEIEVDSSTSLKSVIPEIEISANARVTPASGEEVDLRNDVTYTVTAEDGTVKEYTVTAIKEKSGSSGGGGGSRLSSVKSETETSAKTESEETHGETTVTISFKDTENHWAKEYINTLTEKGYITGKTEDNFAPDDNITRAEFITILFRISGESSEIASKFSDVNADDWYAESINWALENNITQGVSENEFAPNAKITREQMAAFILRFAENMGYELSENTEKTEFKDESSFSSWSYDAIYTMQKAGIISGKDGNLFAPHDNATRAESAKMLAVLLGSK